MKITVLIDKNKKLKTKNLSKKSIIKLRINNFNLQILFFLINRYNLNENTFTDFCFY